MRTLRIIDIMLTIFLLWAHVSIAFWLSNPVPIWTIKNFEFSENLRLITDLIIISLLTFHLFDLLIGKKIWLKLQSNKTINYIIIGSFIILLLPYLKLWFLYYYYAEIMADLIRTLFYLGLIIFWTINIAQRKIY